jgi:quercetin dioxygenase-like cupin family protein
MDLLLFTPGLTLVNAFNDETFVFTTPESTEAAEFEVRLGPGGSGGGNAMAHIHPKTDENFTVRSGRLTVSIDGQIHQLQLGETITIPAGKPHFFRNAHEGETVAIIRFTPAQHQLRFFLNFATIAQNHPEWSSQRSRPLRGSWATKWSSVPERKPAVPRPSRASDLKVNSEIPFPFLSQSSGSMSRLP